LQDLEKKINGGQLAYAHPAISFLVYFKNGIHKLTIAARRPCPEDVPVSRAQVSSQQKKVALRVLSSDYY
jgi:hypothetical protein